MDFTPSYNLSEEEWAERLTDEQYAVLREKRTEPAFSGKYDKFYEEGFYLCGGCGQTLFSSESKFSSGTGWPSFWEPLSLDVLVSDIDYKLSYPRTAVYCRQCGGYLGHVFDDGPPTTGKRYCINSTALEFTKKNR